jgi:hypothetical protein
MLNMGETGTSYLMPEVSNSLETKCNHLLSSRSIKYDEKITTFARGGWSGQGGVTLTWGGQLGPGTFSESETKLIEFPIKFPFQRTQSRFPTLFL